MKLCNRISGNFLKQKFSSIIYRPMEPKDIQQVAKICSYQFTKYEPMVSTLNCSDQEFLQYFYNIQDEFYRMSHVAEDLSKNIIVGALISTDYNAEYNDEVVPESIRPFYAWLIDMRQQFQAQGLILTGLNKVHLAEYSAIHPEYSNKGIMKQLLLRNLQLALKLGYIQSMCESSNPASQHIPRLFGYKQIHFVPYTELHKVIPTFVCNEKVLEGFREPDIPGFMILMQDLTKNPLIK